MNNLDHLSSSQISQYLMCPRKYKLKYIDEIKPTFKPVGLAFGSAVHSAIAYLAAEKMRGNAVSVGKVLSTFRADWQALMCDPIAFNGENEEELMGRAVTLLTQVHDESAEWKVKGAEVPFRVPIVDPDTGEVMVPVDIIGYMDLVLEPDTIIEVKTGMRRWDDNAVKSNIQVTLYSYAYKLIFGKDPQLAVKVLLKQRNPRIETYPTTRSPDDIRWCLNLVREVYESIEKGAFHPCPGWMCEGCEYGGICRANDKKGGDHAE